MEEHGYRVKPRSTAAIAAEAEAFLAQAVPTHLASARALNVAELVDYGLERRRIAVVPVSDEDIPEAEAETRAASGQWIEIWMREGFFEALFEETSKTLRARSTLAHEVGHAILHSEEVRAGRHKPHILVMRRALRSDLRPFEDCEWQAHAFAGMLLMPPKAVARCRRKDPTRLAERFRVSEAFASSQLKRLRKL